jgi:fibronectin-binding autotransporter adhesin
MMTKTFMGLRSGLRLAVAVAAISLLGNLQARATNLFWSGNGTTQGGFGTWNTTGTGAARFDTNAGGPYSTVWSNSNVDSAEFGGTGGQVNLAGPIVVNTITTDIAGFNIGNGNAAGSGGSNTITFSGANAGINTNYAGGTTTISAVINLAGGATSLTKSGAGRLELGNANNPNTTKYTLTGGALTSASIARLSTSAPASLVSDFMTFNGGGWAINTGNQDTGANRGITVKSGGAFFGSTSLTVNLTISSPIVGTEGGGITLTNLGVFVGNAHQAGAQVMLTNTGNSWNGDATISSGTLRLGGNGVIPDTAIVHLTTSGTAFNMTGFDGTAHTETVKSIDGAAGTVAIGTGVLTIANPNGESHAGVVTGSSGGQLIKNGSGAWTLSGSNTGWQGEFILNTGTIGVGSSNSFGNQGTAKVTINGGNLSNTGTGGRSVNAAVPVALNADFSADDSLFNSSQPGQILFNGTANMNANRTITVSGLANLGLTTITETNAGTTLTKNGTGILAIAGNNSTYTGDTTVNNGTLRFSGTTAGTFAGNIFAPGGRVEVSGAGIIGTGTTNTVNLSGGALSCSATRTVAFFNPVNVTANSAITTTSTASTPNFDFGDTTSTSVPFNISGGVTLTLRNDGGDAATDQLRVRLFGGNSTPGAFTISAPIDMPNGSAGSTVELSSFNTTGTFQTFSGVISGTGDYKRSASTGGTGGTTVLTAANTFSGGTQLNDGTIELGVDSVGPANAPTSGPLGTGTIQMSNNSTVALAPNGGNRTLANSLQFNAATANNLGIANPASGGPFNLTLTGDLSLGAATAAVSRSITVTSTGTNIMSGVISDGGTFAGSLTTVGPGTLKITGNNTYSGGTTVSSGKLLVSNTSGSGTGTGAVTVSAGATLGGTGTISGAVTNNGTISPGESINTLTTGAGVVMADNSSLAIELSGTTADKLAMGGVFDLSSLLDTLTLTGSLSGTVTIATYSSVSGTFNTVTGLPSGYGLNYGATALTIAPSCAPGDLNCDGHVDAGDYVYWRKNGGVAGDANYVAWQSHYGNPPGGGTGGAGLNHSTIPEPTSALGAIMALAGSMLSLRIRRKRVV